MELIIFNSQFLIKIMVIIKIIRIIVQTIIMSPPSGLYCLLFLFFYNPHVPSGLKQKELLLMPKMFQPGTGERIVGKLKMWNYSPEWVT